MSPIFEILHRVSLPRCFLIYFQLYNTTEEFHTFYNVLSTNTDRNGLEFVSTVEGGCMGEPNDPLHGESFFRCWCPKCNECLIGKIDMYACMHVWADVEDLILSLNSVFKSALATMYQMSGGICRMKNYIGTHVDALTSDVT
jgi:hypothetical protein